MDGEHRHGRSRRETLGALGAGGATLLAGCVGGRGRRSMNSPDVIADSPTGLVWTFPGDAADGEEIVEVFLDQRTLVRADGPDPTARFRFGATVFGHSDYRHDRITARFQAPVQSDGDTTAVPLFVTPPGGGQSVRVRRDGRETVVVLEELDTEGTIHFDFTAAPQSGPMPEHLRYEFTVTATQEGVLGGTAVARETGTRGIGRER
jgi:hypothetical protein